MVGRSTARLSRPNEPVAGAVPVSEPRRTVPATGCLVCRFVADSVERRIFFVFAEAIGELWFVGRMRAGGFCADHVRRIVSEGNGPRLTGPFEDVLEGWLARRQAAGGPALPVVGAACPICETAGWAADHALGLLASGDVRRIETGLGGVWPICLPHLDRLIDRVPWTEQVTWIDRWRARLLEAAGEALADPSAADRIAGALDILAGRAGEDGAVGVGSSAAAPEADGWRTGLLSEAGLRAEFERGVCPICTAATAGQRRLLAWLVDPGRTANDRRDLDALCGRHLRSLWALDPEHGAAATRSAVERRLAMFAGLPTIDDRPPLRIADRLAWAWRRPEVDAGAGRRVRVGARVGSLWRAVRAPASFVAERLRRARFTADRPCAACVAAATSRRRALALLAATLRSRPGRDAFERSDGLCLRHAVLAAGDPRFEAGLVGLVGAVAEGRVAAVRFELEEALRKSSWSVRYEPAGPEATAWRRAARLVLGEAALPEGGDGSEPWPVGEPDRPQRAV